LPPACASAHPPLACPGRVDAHQFRASSACLGCELSVLDAEAISEIQMQAAKLMGSARAHGRVYGCRRARLGRRAPRAALCAEDVRRMPRRISPGNRTRRYPTHRLSKPSRILRG
jgi:hypothetical protein